MNDDQLGHAACARGWLTDSQLDAARRVRDTHAPPPPLGEILTRIGFLTPEQVRELDTAANPSDAERTVMRSDVAPAAPPADDRTILRSRPFVDESAKTAAPSGSSQIQDTAHSPSTSPPSPRRTLGKYEIVSELGRGGMGVVYKAWHPGLRTHVAVKVLLTGDDASAEEVERFRREAHASARLQHPAIVRVHDVGEADGKSYIAMEFVEGARLDQVLKEPARYGITPRKASAQGGRPPLPEATAILFAKEIAEALDAAHRAGVVHRDLKPSNVMRDAAGRLKIMDFGLARVLGAGDIGTTRTGALLGTPAYMAPEQAEGLNRDVDARTDVYQVGAILYEMLTGRMPYDGATALDVVQQVRTEDPLPPRRLLPGLSRDAETICLTAMARDRARRFAGAGALAEDCGRLLAGEAIRARPQAWWERPARWVRRHRVVSSAVAVCLSFLLWATWTAYDKMRLEEKAIADHRARAAEAEREAQERARLHREVVGNLREIAATNLESALLVRRAGGDLREAGPKILARLQGAVRRALENDPEQAEPHYHLGRMLRALLRFDEALAEQEKALAKDGDFAPALYEAAILRTRTLSIRLAAIRGEWTRMEAQRLLAESQDGGACYVGAQVRSCPADGELAGNDPEAKRLQEQVKAELARLKMVAIGEEAVQSGPVGSLLNRPVVDHAPGDSSHGALSEAKLACANGLLLAVTAVCDDTRDTAREALDRALALDPLMEEAYEGLAQIAESGGDARAAEAAYTRGLEKDKGYARFHAGRGQARLRLGGDALARPAEADALLASAESDLGRALELDPADALVWVARAETRLLRAALARRGRRDAEPFRTGAEADAARALEGNPDSVATWILRGRLRVQRALQAQAQGGDPRPRLDEAIADFGQALARDAKSYAALVQRARARVHLGRARFLRKEDPSQAFSEANADCKQAADLDPATAEAWTVLGLLGTAVGDWYVGIGDAEALKQYAYGDLYFGKACKADPRSYEAFLARGRMLAHAAPEMARHGQKPDQHLAFAAKYLGTALEIDPGAAEAWLARAELERTGATLLRARGEDAAERVGKAEADYAKALELEPESVEARAGRGWLRFRAERWAEAVADFEAAMALDPASEAGFREALAEGRKRGGK